MSQCSPNDRLAAGTPSLPAVSTAFAATQAAWRFYGNAAVSPGQLAQPLIAHVDQAVAASCVSHVLVACDWSFLSYPNHTAKADRTEYSRTAGAQEKGYELFTALALSDSGGQPLGPVAMQLRFAGGVMSTWGPQVQEAFSRLDRLVPALREVAGLHLGGGGAGGPVGGSGKTPVFIIDREADSVGHYRQWSTDGHLFLVRADRDRVVLCEGRQTTLTQVVEELHRRDAFGATREVQIKGRCGYQRVAQTQVTLHRPARQHRVIGKGKRKKKQHQNIPGPQLPLRLVVSEVRDAAGKLLARWLLLTNAPAFLPAVVLATWYYWRWRIETYHKLLKGAGLQVEHWRQEDAGALLKRLLVGAMSVTLVWQLARDATPAGEELRALLVRLSGRQMARGSKPKPAKGFTEPALLAGLGVLLPMLALLETTDAGTLAGLVRQVLGLTVTPHQSSA